VRRQDEVFVEIENKESQGHGGNREVREPAGNKQPETVGQVIDWLQQELADVAVLDVCGDLPIVLVNRSQGVNQCDQQVIGDHLGERISSDGRASAFAFINRPPNK